MDYYKTIEYRIIPLKACKIIRNCSGCGRKEKFQSTENFRVNANGNQIDVWLIYQCEKCKHTYNLTVYERTRPSKIPKDLYLNFLANDKETALRYGVNRELFSRNKAEADWDGVEYMIEQVKEISYKNAEQTEGQETKQNVNGKDGLMYLWMKEEGSKEKLIVYNPYSIPVRADKILSEVLELSRTQIKKLLKEERIVPILFSGV